MCRAGTTSLFVFGNEFPEKEDIERWLDMDFSEISSLSSNDIGLYGMVQ